MKPNPSEVVLIELDFLVPLSNPEGKCVRLRIDARMRTTSQVILVRAARHVKVKGTGLVRRFAPDIVRRADEPAVGLAYQLWRFGKPIPNALKKAWADELEGFDDYTLAKYRLESREVKSVAVMNLAHPKAEAVSRLARGELRTSDWTWEAVLSARGAGKETWLEALPMMGHMALVRNLRNLLEAGIPPEQFMERLVAGHAGGHGRLYCFKASDYADFRRQCRNHNNLHLGQWMEVRAKSGRAQTTNREARI